MKVFCFLSLGNSFSSVFTQGGNNFGTMTRLGIDFDLTQSKHCIRSWNNDIHVSSYHGIWTHNSFGFITHRMISAAWRIRTAVVFRRETNSDFEIWKPLETAVGSVRDDQLAYVVLNKNWSKHIRLIALKWKSQILRGSDDDILW
jgi:hypothetical protein